MPDRSTSDYVSIAVRRQVNATLGSLLGLQRETQPTVTLHEAAASLGTAAVYSSHPVPGLARYESDPVAFMERELGIRHIYDEIVQMCESFRDCRTTDVQAGHGVGKTFFAGLGLALWWVFCKGGAFISTAPGHRQVRRLFWKNVRRGHAKLKAKYGRAVGRCDVVQLTVDPWRYGYGFAAPEWNPDAALGEHEALLAVFVDEANAIGQTIWDALGSLTTGEENRRINLSNPTAPDTPFYRSCNRASDGIAHQRIKIPVWSHPNIKAGKELVGGAVTQQWINDVRDTYGEDSSYWKSRVEAEFPEEVATTLIPRVAFEAAMERYKKEKRRFHETKETIYTIGGDIGERRDNTAFVGRQNYTFNYFRIHKPLRDDRDLARAVGIARNLLDMLPKGSLINIDGNGIGAGVASALIDAGYFAQSIRVGEASTSKQEYKLIRDELPGLARQLFLQGEIAIRPPADEDEHRFLEALKDELAAIHWDRDIQGRFRLEENKFTKKRLGRSPDRAWAFFFSLVGPQAAAYDDDYIQEPTTLGQFDL